MTRRDSHKAPGWARRGSAHHCNVRPPTDDEGLHRTRMGFDGDLSLTNVPTTRIPNLAHIWSRLDGGGSFLCQNDPAAEPCLHADAACHAAKATPSAPSPIRPWCRDPELNWGHPDFQSGALPAELSRHPIQLALAEPTGLEPATSGLTGQCANQLHHGSAHEHLRSGRWMPWATQRVAPTTPVPFALRSTAWPLLQSLRLPSLESRFARFQLVGETGFEPVTPCL